ncbi:hypothetical protein COY26_02360 [Candidatus Woesearchaeota archaeon CG_4_10_14_0_2_um_filter_33_10]|nr:MAG: hypothetical protein AUJ83_04860 [Candidatus Woesearchaeota archaeon CG1_02_33_12]PIU72890.1 MAG: hypothetical protein COS79_00635 [Candidatus Woesearchaeota archaeon CG06_land_8_20_14_3_00_33_13]PIZ53249.1 MAG: hypothetical protein COY26_02360 [Candidatus Woesearchaeota archaeon CG_4_10_14_0_2_um_filter_33_10]
MAENFYKRIESDFFYQTIKIVAGIGAIGGAAMAIAGTITGDPDLTRWGAYIGLPSFGYIAGTLVEEEQFEKASDLEKKLK